MSFRYPSALFGRYELFLRRILAHGRRRIASRVDAADRLISVVRQQLRELFAFLPVSWATSVQLAHRKDVDVPGQPHIIIGDHRRRGELGLDQGLRLLLDGCALAYEEWPSKLTRILDLLVYVGQRIDS